MESHWVEPESLSTHEKVQEIMTLILGRKRGMTQLFDADGTVHGVTVVEVGPCVVTQVRTQEKDGYDAIQLGWGDIADKRLAKPQLGQYKKAGLAPKRFMREERLSAAATCKVGDTVTCDIFKEGDLVDVVGTMKGRGFARETSKNLRVVRVDAARNLLYIKGSVAGANNGFIQVRTAKTGVRQKAKA